MRMRQLSARERGLFHCAPGLPLQADSPGAAGAFRPFPFLALARLAGLQVTAWVLRVRLWIIPVWGGTVGRDTLALAVPTPGAGLVLSALARGVPG